MFFSDRFYQPLYKDNETKSDPLLFPVYRIINLFICLSSILSTQYGRYIYNFLYCFETCMLLQLYIGCKLLSLSYCNQQGRAAFLSFLLLSTTFPVCTVVDSILTIFVHLVLVISFHLMILKHCHYHCPDSSVGRASAF